MAEDEGIKTGTGEGEAEETPPKSEPEHKPGEDETTSKVAAELARARKEAAEFRRKLRELEAAHARDTEQLERFKKVLAGEDGEIDPEAKLKEAEARESKARASLLKASVISALATAGVVRPAHQFAAMREEGFLAEAQADLDTGNVTGVEEAVKAFVEKYPDVVKGTTEEKGVPTRTNRQKVDGEAETGLATLVAKLTPEQRRIAEAMAQSNPDMRGLSAKDAAEEYAWQQAQKAGLAVEEPAWRKKALDTGKKAA